MFRRLLLCFGLLVLALVAALLWAVSAYVEPGEARRRLQTFLAGAGLCGVLMVVLFSLALTRRFRRPVRELVEAVSRVGSGGVGPRVGPGDDAEVGALAESFNQASEALTARITRLEEDRQQLRTVLSGMVEGVVALDANQRILYVNDRASELLELPTPAPVGRLLWEVVRHRHLLDAVRNAQEREEPHREEFAWTGAVPRSLTVHAARLPGAPPRGTVLVLHDTTELRRLERLREDFVANVSHELKTPLSVIKVCVETLLDGAIEDAQHRGRFLEQIARQSDRLHALILDLLSLARIESGQELFDFGPVSLAPLARACAERHRTRAEARGQSLVVAGDSEELRAWADEEAVDQILENLLDNALKYTPDGGRIEVRWLRRDDQACVEVADTGIGIPEGDLPRIFERFYRVDKARSREMGGTGLGLSIVKHLVQAMHGSVRASSAVGQGTTFRVCLPIAQP
jgi:two-component system phosphate regulon sensor histidine kinase PhoR